MLVDPYLSGSEGYHTGIPSSPIRPAELTGAEVIAVTHAGYDHRGQALEIAQAGRATGLATAVTPAWATTTPVAAGFTLGLGAMTVIYGGWSLIARDPTKDHWALTVVGLVLEIAPWVGGFAGDGAAWVTNSAAFTRTGQTRKLSCPVDGCDRRRSPAGVRNLGPMTDLSA